MKPGGDMPAAELLSMLDSIVDGVAVLSLKQRYVYLNPAAIALLGPLHLEGAPPVSYLQPDEQTRVEPSSMPLVRGLSGEETAPFRVFVKNPSTAQGRHLSLSGGPWFNSKGEILGAVEVLSDVTSCKQVEDEARRALDFLDNIIEHVPAMIFVKDARELRFERFNRAGEELLGLPREALMGKNDYDFFPRAQADSFIKRDREALAGRAMVEIPEEPIDLKAGRRWLSTRKVPVLDSKGNPEFLLGISVDITARKAAQLELETAHALLEQRVAERTAQLQRANAELQKEIAERKRAEEALLLSQEQLQQSQKLEAVGRLAGGIAHDFNNMLSAMLGYAGLVALSLPPDAEAQQDVKQIVLAGERAAALIRQLLAFSRKQVLQPTVLDVGHVVSGMTEMLRRLLGERVELQVEVEPGTCCVMADATQMEQVLLNLSINARDAMPNGGHLKIAIGPVSLPDERLPPVPLKPGDYVRLTVSDDGVGMNEETKQRVFEPFFTTKPRGQGTGLGAATVFGVVTQSGGDVRVESEVGRGTTFEIYLPRVEGRVDEPPALSEVLRAQKRTATVLLVEDEPMVRAATARILTSAGIKVLEANTPDGALSIASESMDTIDLLLTDVVLPTMNGRELADNILLLRPRMRVLFMSGYAEEAVLRDQLVATGAAFLPKPFSPDTLVRRIDEVLNAS
ncbi:MAG: PAS domain-containing protein [Archangium sp.]|nr:PAS domain-containing protein [Archangium sp.]